MTTTNRNELLKIANLVRPALAMQDYIPALQHIQFNGGYATAYNDISAISVRASVGLGRCLPGDLLIKALGSLTADSVLFQEGKDGALVLVSGRSKLKLPTLGANRFPFEWPKATGPELHFSDDMLKGVERCLISVSNDPTHPAQMGVTLEVDDAGYAVLFSTDNFTVSRYQTKDKVKLPGDAPVILPTFFCRSLIALAKAFPKEDVALRLQSEALLVLIGGEAKLFSKTAVDLEPLNFHNIIEKYIAIKNVASSLHPIPDAFDGALGRALLVMEGEMDPAVRIEINKGMLEIHASSKVGDSDDSMGYDGPDFKGHFHVDPKMVLRGTAVSSLTAMLPKVLIMADAEAQFIHLISHCSR